MAKRIFAIFVSGLAAWAFLAIASPVASAVTSLTAGTCNGRPYNYIVAYFDNPGQGRLPLRCGDDKFGLNHIKARGHLDGGTANMIQATLTYGEQKDSGAKVLFDQNCNTLYTVAYGYNARNGNDQAANPIGIITAYPPSTTLTAGQADAVRAEGYRTDCTVYVPIDTNS
jgi:hypothetical protein